NSRSGDKEPRFMELTVQNRDGVAVVAVRVEHLDAGNAEDFKREIAPVLAENTQVVFDMSELQFLDSAGLGALLSCLRKLSTVGGDLKLYALTRPVRNVFDIARMHRIFEIFST